MDTIVVEITYLDDDIASVSLVPNNSLSHSLEGEVFKKIRLFDKKNKVTEYSEEYLQARRNALSVKNEYWVIKQDSLILEKPTNSRSHR